MGAREDVKSAGLPSVKYVFTTANVNKTTFYNWYHSNNQLFSVVVAGVKAIKENESRKEMERMFNPDERLSCLEFVETKESTLRYHNVTLTKDELDALIKPHQTPKDPGELK